MDTDLKSLLGSQLNGHEWVEMENGGSEIKLKFSHKLSDLESQEQNIFMSNLFDIIMHRKYIVKNISFKFINKEGSNFDFNLRAAPNTWPIVARNGTVSLYLNREEVAEFQALSGQRSNRDDRLAIYAFDPDYLRDSNCIIFYTRNLLECVVENQ